MGLELRAYSIRLIIPSLSGSSVFDAPGPSPLPDAQVLKVRAASPPSEPGEAIPEYQLFASP